jgi:hypothetical protein
VSKLGICASLRLRPEGLGDCVLLDVVDEEGGVDSAGRLKAFPTRQRRIM